jgi:hypothetical protein
MSTEALVSLAAERRTERLGRNAAPMPPRIDAALSLIVAGRLLDPDIDKKRSQHESAFCVRQWRTERVRNPVRSRICPATRRIRALSDTWH